jgi:hypothetical protein
VLKLGSIDARGEWWVAAAGESDVAHAADYVKPHDGPAFFADYRHAAPRVSGVQDLGNTENLTVAGGLRASPGTGSNPERELRNDHHRRVEDGYQLSE